MSEQPTQKPAALRKDSLKPMSYLMAMAFHPAIKLDKKKGFDFARIVADCIDPQDISLTDSAWRFGQPFGSEAGIGLEVKIEPGGLQIEASFPTHPKEWFEQRYQMILDHFESTFHPQLVIQSGALMRATLDVDGDARVFLAHKVMHLDQHRLKPLDRPVHLVGLRLFLPPFERPREVKRGRKTVTENVTTDWSIDLKVESLLADPSKLFLEANAQWPNPTAWTADAIMKAVGRLATVSNYLETEVVELLKFDPTGQEEAP